MAHARNTRTEYLNHFKFKKKSLALKLLHLYLPMLADREGRLIDEPDEIQELAFTHHPELDINAMLHELESMDFLIRYEIEDLKIIQLLNWSIEQSPHGSERDSRIPDVNGMLTINARRPAPANTIIKGEFSLEKYVPVKKRLYNGALTVKEPLPNALIPDSGSLTPESGSRIADSKYLTPDRAPSRDVDNSGNVNNLTHVVSCIFEEFKIQQFNSQDPDFQNAISIVKSESVWIDATKTAVLQKAAKGQHATAAYVYGIAKNKAQASEPTEEKVVPLHQDTTISGLRKRAALVGMRELGEEERWDKVKFEIERREQEQMKKAA